MYDSGELYPTFSKDYPGVIRDRSGKATRYYFRPTKQHDKVRIKAEPYTDEFDNAYAPLRQAYKQFKASGQPMPERERKSRTPPATLKWLCEQYYKSKKFRNLADRTRERNKRILDEICQDVTDPATGMTLGEWLLAAIEPVTVDWIADRKRKFPSAADRRVKVVSALFNWALRYKIKGVTMNPAANFDLNNKPTEGHRAWRKIEVEKWRQVYPVGTSERLAFELLLRTVTRIGEAVHLGPHNIEGDTLKIWQEKTQSHKVIAFDAELRTMIKQSNAGKSTWLVTDFNTPFASSETFRNWFQKRRKRAGLPDGCTVHGLRSTFTNMAYDAGLSEAEISAALGHTNNFQVASYGKTRDRAKMAAKAIRKVFG